MNKKEVFWGLLFILAAILIIVNKLGYFPEISIFNIVVSVVLVGIIIKSIIYGMFPGILIPVAFLCIIYAEQLNITELTPGPVLATAVLGSIGLSLIFKKNYHSKWYHHSEHFEKVIDQPDGNTVHCSANFGSSMKYINSDNLENANIKCSFGAMKVYFDNAVVSSGSASIYLDISFSGVELYIPKSWNVNLDVNTSFGSIEEKNRKVASESPVVTLKGNVSFSGVEIIYV